MKYKFIDDLTSDVYFECYGKDLKEIFENAALAMFEVICKINQVRPKNKLIVKIKGKNAKELLFNWLQELIAQVDVEEMFFSKFNITKISETELTSEICGEEISKEKGNTVVKAVTNYKFSLEKNNKGFTATVSLDI